MSKSMKNYPVGKVYSETCLKRPLSKRLKNGFKDKFSLNADQKYCRTLQGEHSAVHVLSTCITLLFVIKIFVLSNFEWLLNTGFIANDLHVLFISEY